MPLETPFPNIDERVHDLNTRFEGEGALSILSHAMSDPMVGNLALVSSFGAESVVLLHLVSIIDPTTPVLFIDTELLFQETLAYQRDLAARFGLSNVRILKARREAIFARDPDTMLNHFNPDACCALRKIEPLEKGLSGFDAWITGRKRYQGGVRQEIAIFEADDKERLKVNPLAKWSRADVAQYIAANDLPRHPLVGRGYPSIGCAPCTTKVNMGEDIRAGRWRNTEKIECGIHLGADGTLQRRAI